MRPRNDTDWLAVAVEMCRRTVIVDGNVYSVRRQTEWSLYQAATTSVV